MGSFKLQKGGSAKDQARTSGVFLVLIGIIVSLVVWFEIGVGLIVLGGVLFMASFAASE